MSTAYLLEMRSDNDLQTELIDSKESPGVCCKSCPANDGSSRKNIKRLCLSLLVGQILAALLSASGICAALLARDGFNLPFAQNLPYYTLLLLVYGSFRLGMLIKKDPIDNETKAILTTSHSRSWRFFVLLSCGLLDLHAYWAIVSAYAYTNITSIQLLDCIGIPTSMLLSYMMLRHRYSWTHYAGAVICVVGASLMVAADLLSENNKRSKELITAPAISPGTNNALIGDLLAITGAMLYGASSVFQEYATVNYGPITYLTSLGLVAAPITAIYCAVLEHSPLTEVINFSRINGRTIPMVALFYFMGYVASMYFLDSLMAFTIIHFSAVFINLSLLTADIYSLLAGILLFQLRFHYVYFISFGTILIGVILFAICKVKTKQTLV